LKISASVTLTVHVAVIRGFSREVAVIIATPEEIVVTTPLLSTVAIVSSLEDQVTLPSAVEGTGVTINVSVLSVYKEISLLLISSVNF